MSNGFIFNSKTILLVVFLITVHQTLRLLLPTENHISTKSLNKFSSVQWRSREILQQFNSSEYSTLTAATSIECSQVLATKCNRSCLCHLVKTTDDCKFSDGFLQYFYFLYCPVACGFGFGFAFFMLVIWIIFLFVVLGVTADDYFCPSVTVISKTLKMSQNVAGVTFLAYGNGAPDIFSAIIAFSSVQENESTPELGIQAIFGGGMFITTAAVSCISLCAPNKFTVARRPFIRDILFYISAVGWTFYSLYNKEISMLESIGLIIFYVVYVIVVIGGHCLYQYLKKKKREDRVINMNSSETAADENEMIESKSFSTSIPVDSCRQSSIIVTDEKTPLLRPLHTLHLSISPTKKFLYGVIPFTSSDWEQSGLCGKIFMVFKAPAVFLLNITVPTLDFSEPDHKWNKWLDVIHCVTGPVFIVMATKVGMITVVGQFPLWALILSLGVLLAITVALLTRNDKPPRFHWMFACMAFVVSVIWIYITANEIVNLLETFGIVFKLSSAILGLTLLAWGVSIGEFVSSIVIARQGYPNMAISSCFGGSLLNLLLGIGIACTFVSIQQGHSVKLPHQYHQHIISASFLTLSLISSGVIIPLMGFRISRSYSVYLLVVYLVYLIVSIVAEIKHI